MTGRKENACLTDFGIPCLPSFHSIYSFQIGRQVEFGIEVCCSRTATGQDSRSGSYNPSDTQKMCSDTQKMCSDTQKMCSDTQKMCTNVPEQLET